MPARILLAIVLAVICAAPAMAQISGRFGDANTTDIFLRNVTGMFKDPVFLAVTIIVIVISRKFLYWGMIVVGGVAAPLGYFASLQTQFRYYYYTHGMVPWLTAVVIGLGLGIIAVFAFRFIGARE